MKPNAIHENTGDLDALKRMLFESLNEKLAHSGFKQNYRHSNFVRRLGDVAHIFQITCLDGNPGFRIQPGVAVRIETVEAIFHKTSGFEAKYQGTTPTMGCSVGALLAGDSRNCEFRLESEAEVKAVTGKILDVFDKVAATYFLRWSSLVAIDAELNDNPNQGTPHRALAWFRCSTGLIVAKLVGRSDYGKLVSLYVNIMSNDNKGFYLKRFQSLVDSLESVESGSGLRRGGTAD